MNFAVLFELKMKTTIYVILAIIVLGKSKIYAQEDGGKVLINTIFDDPMKNRWHVAGYAGLEVQGKSSGGLYYGFAARYILPKYATFTANVALDLTKQVKSGGFVSYDAELMEKLPSYKNIELRGVFHFRDAEGTKNHHVKLGSDGKYEYSTNYASKSRVVQGFTASLNINSRAYVQNRDSNEIIDLQDAAGNDMGYINGVATGQNNVFVGVGFHAGEYTWYKGKFTGGAYNTTKTRRFKRTVNTNIEFLFAPAIAVGKEAYYKNKSTNSIETYKINDVKKKNLGFRISAEILNGKPGWFMRMEFGIKPGIQAPLNSDTKMGKFLTNGYVSFGLGIGF